MKWITFNNKKNRGLSRLSITKKHNWLTQYRFQLIMLSFIIQWILDFYYHNESPRAYAQNPMSWIAFSYNQTNGFKTASKFNFEIINFRDACNQSKVKINNLKKFL
jgi:hypothetical protein